MTNKPLPEPRRKDIFLPLVEAQDNEMSPAESRKLVAERFGVSEGQVRRLSARAWTISGRPCDGAPQSSGGPRRCACACPNSHPQRLVFCPPGRVKGE